MPTLSALDDPSELEAFLDAVRWGAATNADRGYLQAPFRSGVSIEDYQLDPLVRAIDMARTILLMTDDGGLGKTIEAGLVIQEVLLRNRLASSPAAFASTLARHVATIEAAASGKLGETRRISALDDRILRRV